MNQPCEDPVERNAAGGCGVKGHGRDGEIEGSVVVEEVGHIMENQEGRNGRGPVPNPARIPSWTTGPSTSELPRFVFFPFQHQQQQLQSIYYCSKNSDLESNGTSFMHHVASSTPYEVPGGDNDNTTVQSVSEGTGPGSTTVTELTAQASPSTAQGVVGVFDNGNNMTRMIEENEGGIHENQDNGFPVIISTSGAVDQSDFHCNNESGPITWQEGSNGNTSSTPNEKQSSSDGATMLLNQELKQSEYLAGAAINSLNFVAANQQLTDKQEQQHVPAVVCPSESRKKAPTPLETLGDVVCRNEPKFCLGSSQIGGSSSAMEGDCNSTSTREILNAEEMVRTRDAQKFLDRVKEAFSAKPHLYSYFLHVMNYFRSDKIRAEDLAVQLANLFNEEGCPELIKDLNNFLPPTCFVDSKSLLKKKGKRKTSKKQEPLPPPSTAITVPRFTVTTSAQQSPFLPILPLFYNSFPLVTVANDSSFSTFPGLLPPPLPTPPIPLPMFCQQQIMSHYFPIQNSHVNNNMSHLQSFPPFAAHHYISYQQQQQHHQFGNYLVAGTQIPNVPGIGFSPPNDIFMPPPFHPGFSEHGQGGNPIKALEFANKIKRRLESKGNRFNCFSKIMESCKENGQFIYSKLYNAMSELFQDDQDILQEFCEYMPEILNNSAAKSSTKKTLAKVAKKQENLSSVVPGPGPSGFLPQAELKTAAPEISTGNENTTTRKLKLDGPSTPIQPISHVDFSHCERYGPSYRIIGKNCTFLKTSGQTELCTEVLNNVMVIVPSLVGMDSSRQPGSTKALKRKLEQQINDNFEEERFEWDRIIDANVAAIQSLERVYKQMSGMSVPEQLKITLDDYLGGTSTVINQQAIKRLYPKIVAGDVIEALKKEPATVLGVILARLKQKDEDWMKAKHAFNKMTFEKINSN